MSIAPTLDTTDLFSIGSPVSSAMPILYDNPVHSDLIVKIGNRQLHLISSIIENGCPTLYQNLSQRGFVRQMPTPLTDFAQSDNSNRQLFVVPKSVIELDETKVSFELFDSLMQYIYTIKNSDSNVDIDKLLIMTNYFGLHEIYDKIVDKLSEPQVIELLKNNDIDKLCIIRRSCLSDEKNTELFWSLKPEEIIALLQSMNNPTMQSEDEKVKSMIRYFHTNPVTPELKDQMIGEIESDQLSNEFIRTELKDLVTPDVFVKIVTNQPKHTKKYTQYAIGIAAKNYPGYELMTSEYFKKYFNVIKRINNTIGFAGIETSDDTENTVDSVALKHKGTRWCMKTDGNDHINRGEQRRNKIIKDTYYKFSFGSLHIRQINFIDKRFNNDIGIFIKV